jgi:hypothetical protein
MAEQRKPRNLETREQGERRKNWRRPSALPTPEPRDGLHFRWIRTSLLGQSDNPNVSTRFREGYTPVKAEDYPELYAVSDLDSRFQGNVEIGGLMLCSIPEEIARDRVEGQLANAQNAADAVDRNYLRENDPRMPVLQSERSTRTSFGR